MVGAVAVVHLRRRLLRVARGVDRQAARPRRAGGGVCLGVNIQVALGGVLPFCVGAAPFEDVFAQVALEAGRRAQLAAGAVSDAAEIIGFGFFF